MTDQVTERIRREPPRFREVTVDRVEWLSGRMVAVTFAGPDLKGLSVDEPAASVRLLLPSSGESELIVPRWDGNQFLLPGSERPLLRTFTPRRLDSQVPALDLWIVVHGEEGASGWAQAAAPGDPAAISGTGRGYAVDRRAPGYLLAGDETAIPAMSQLLEEIPDRVPVRALIEVGGADGRFTITDHPRAEIAWLESAEGATPGNALVRAVEGVDLADGTLVWAAGEAAAMQRIRRHLFEERALSRRQAVVRGYWKHGRAGGD
jgi:NADPH-dependent ferric siderophore reductase